MKNSRVWKATDIAPFTGEGNVGAGLLHIYLGRLLSPTAQAALKLAREFWPQAGTIRVELVKR